MLAWKTIAAIGVTAGLLAGCGSMKISRPDRYINSIKDKGTIALVSFGLNNAIMHDSKTVQDEKEEEAAANELKYFKEAANGLYTQFRASYARGLGGHAVLAPASIEGNAGYREKQKPKEKKLFGLKYTETSSSSSSKSMDPMDNEEMNEASYTSPDNIYRLTISETKYLDQLAKELNAGLLMFVDYKASFLEASEAKVEGRKTSISVGNATLMGSAVMDVRARIKLYEPGKGVVWRKEFHGRSKKQARMVGKNMNSKDYPELIRDANPELISDMQQVFKLMEEGYKPPAKS